jgi:hypothetical protein
MARTAQRHKVVAIVEKTEIVSAFHLVMHFLAEDAAVRASILALRALANYFQPQIQPLLLPVEPLVVRDIADPALFGHGCAFGASRLSAIPQGCRRHSLDSMDRLPQHTRSVAENGLQPGVGALEFMPVDVRSEWIGVHILHLHLAGRG